MLRLKGNRFVLFAEIEPVNYFLLSQEEQEAIDAAFETWIAQIDYQVQWYLQNRYVDLSEPIEEMKKNMFESEDLPENAFNYGRSMIDDLERWQAMTPRFETKRYILFPLKVREEDIQADDEEEFEERVLEKAFQELYRRFNTAKSGLHKSKMEVHLLTNEGILEVLYHAFNRRKAIRNKFKNLKLYENLALYPTADQDLPHIEMVKGMIESDVVEENKKAV